MIQNLIRGRLFYKHNIMEHFDPAFIQPAEHRPKPTTIEVDLKDIPVIDLRAITGSPDPWSISDTSIGCLASKIGDACKKWGFFQVINHGVPLDKLEKAELAAKHFFSLPMEEKTKVRRTKANPLGYYEAEHTKNVRDWKEVFDFSVRDPTVIPVSLDDLEARPLVDQWPQDPPNFKEACKEYAVEVEKLGFKLVDLIGLSLGLQADRLRGFYEEHTSFVRVNHYPPCPHPDLALGVSRHKDSGGLTILAQDDVGGLEVKRKEDGQWIPVKPMPGAFIINIGDIFQVWSNDEYESVEHRVVVNGERDRLSIPFFFNPSHHVMVQPLKELLSHQNNPHYTPYNWGKFFATKKGSNLKKLEVENLQISHFRVSK